MRLIDADVLRDLIDGGFDIDFDETPELKQELLNMIDYQETIDAAPVRRGKWTKLPDGEYMCSECGFTPWYYRSPEESGYKQCPNCGARMEEQ